MNHSDSERLASVLVVHGLSYAPNMDGANLVIFNTCGVRQMAEDRVYGQIHNLKQQATSNKQQAKIVVTGCLADRKDVQMRLKNKVDLFFSISDLKKFEHWIIEDFLGTSESANDSLKQESIAYLSVNPRRTNSFQALVPIMTGCNNFCSYCVVPYARGREISRPASEIVDEVKELIASGYREITLLGQNVNSYCDNSRITSHQSSVTFSDLLKKINDIPGDFWIRFASSHPKDMSGELIETITSLSKVCELVHLPIQSGNDDILRAMNRNYTREHYLGLIGKIKKGFASHKPDVPFAITSDIIVGFPGETEEQFMESAEIMKKVGFDMVYFGQYSQRPDTAAAKFTDDVPKAEKARREKHLNDILEKSSLDIGRALVGKTLEVLAEKEKTGFYFGKTRTGKNVKIISGTTNLTGEIVKVEITKSNAWNLEAKLL